MSSVVLGSNLRSARKAQKSQGLGQAQCAGKFRGKYKATLRSGLVARAQILINTI
jgi:hypothetical protein